MSLNLKNVVLKNALIMSQDEMRAIFSGDILVQNGIIVDVGVNLSGPASVDLSGKLVLPALFNAHTHLGEAFFRGVADGLPLERYIGLWNELKISSSGSETEIRQASADLTIKEIVCSGAGTICSIRGWSETEKWAINGFFGYPFMRFGKLNSFIENAAENFAEIYRSYSSTLTHIGLAIHSISSVSPDDLEVVTKLLKEFPETFLTIHTAETQSEVERVQATWGGTPIEVLNDFELLGPRTILVHCVWANEHDLDLVASSHSNICICPVANLKLNVGFPPLEKFVERGICLTIGTDGPATSNTLDILQVLRLLAVMDQKRALSPQRLIDMITCEAARAFGVENHQGSIEAGKQADLLIIDLERSALNPVSQIVSNIVYAGPVRVSGLIIKGQALVWEGNLCHASAGAITKEFENWYNRIWSVANIPDM